MSLKNRLTKLEQIAEQAAQVDAELNARLLKAIEANGGWKAMLAEAATVENPSRYQEGMDLSQLSDAELTAMMVAEIQAVERWRASKCQ